ncbi:MAG: deoxyguanosinetriphosphate triphosphohydrolase [Lentisphaerota bacterium]
MLAPCAALSSGSLGRKHQEPQHDYRSEFQRDRDRVLHSRAFRRLEYKTQVFINASVDHYRTRLTHTIEMAAVARTLARALRANEDLAEAIALAHDLGHSPFGHVGEEALNDLMKNEGGFDHNLQSLRCVELLEYRYPEFTGLNLTWEVRAGLRKHLAHVPGAELDGHPIGPFQGIEAQIADVADDIAYFAHDVDDGLEAGLLTEEQLRTQALWQKAGEKAHSAYGPIPEDRHLNVIVRSLLDIQVEDVLRTSDELLTQCHPASRDEVMSAPARIINFSPAMKEMLTPFKAFLFKNMYFHPGVSDDSRRAVGMMRKLFLYYVDHPEAMGRKARARLPAEGLWRTVCDYIAGMTDRYALEEYERFGLA